MAIVYVISYNIYVYITLSFQLVLKQIIIRSIVNVV